MSPFRTVLFWCHLTTASVVGLVVAVMSVTGVTLAYQRQVQYWADTRHFRSTPADVTRARLPLATLVEAARRTTTERVTSVTFRRGATEPVALTAGSRTIYANPYTGQVYGDGEGNAWRGFFTTMNGWHRWLGASLEHRATGRAVTSASNLAFLFLILSGFYLWWPSALTGPRLRQVLFFRRDLPTKARRFNWHHVIGFWSAVPLAVIVSAGVVMSYPWANAALYRAFGEAVPATGDRGGGGRGAAPSRSDGSHTGSTDRFAAVELAFDKAAVVEPAWQVLTIRVPERAASAVVVAVDAGTGGQPQLKGTLTVNPTMAIAPRWEPFDSQSPGRRARSWLRFLHTGEAAGLTGQTIAALASVGALVLVYTGFALAMGRLRNRRSNVRTGVG